MINVRPSLEICRRLFVSPVVGAEIGVLGGGNAGNILKYLDELTMMHLVDSYGGITDKDPKFIEFRKKYDPVADKVCWHVKTSVEAARECDDESFDFVYLDANHRYESVISDIEAWWPKLKPSGILCGHDYFTFGSVKKAVDDWMKKHNIFLFTANPDWWVFRNG